MKFTVVTILPELVEPALAAGVVGRAREAGTIAVGTVNPRDFTSDRHRTVDDTPYGGGPGMVMKAEPLLAAIAAAVGVEPAHRILLTPAGRPLTQARVRELAAAHRHLVLVCGRYEGVDERVIEHAIDEELSIGDYVLSGGELGALVVIDAVARLVPGVLGEPASADEESHSAGLLEYPQYTRPPKLVLAVAGDESVPDASLSGVVREVPPVLFGGNHAAIASWRRRQSIERTARRRPDMFARFAPTKADRKLVTPLHARTHLALVHHPVHDRTGAVVTTSLTNFDIHDLARSSLTYGLAAYHIVTPITSQREKAEHIARLWLDDTPARPPPSSGSRANALALVRTADSIETVVAELTAQYGRPPRIVATSARTTSFPGAARCTPEELRAAATVAGLGEERPEPLLLLLGTGWGLADDRIPNVAYLLSPIEGTADWNHLSVRSAAAILLDRLFGRASG
ncbi:MAG: tRNA (guanosine(37)-N1)-methyltransferase TrmD [Deltaproteobacteria bacterium]|nr:tRNA (guanosine(37)-N1)-methyltransferase TrmD [Deltaproteobacteria bacterium]